MKVPVGVSNRHVHLSDEDLEILFGTDTLIHFKDLKQPGQFASDNKVTIKTQKSQIHNLRVLGPTRKETQVEISKTDSYKLGINPPVNESGNLENASEVTIEGPNGSVTKPCVIIATRHIHINRETRVKLGLTNVDKVSVKVLNEKGGILNNVSIRESEPAYFEIHLDTDDANANLINQNDKVEIIVE